MFIFLFCEEFLGITGKLKLPFKGLNCSCAKPETPIAASTTKLIFKIILTKLILSF